MEFRLVLIKFQNYLSIALENQLKGLNIINRLTWTCNAQSGLSPVEGSFPFPCNNYNSWAFDLGENYSAELKREFIVYQFVALPKGTIIKWILIHSIPIISWVYVGDKI